MKLLHGVQALFLGVLVIDYTDAVLTSGLDVFAPTLRVARQQYRSAVTDTDIDSALRAVRKQNKLQEYVSDEIPFPCPLIGGRSPEPPTSVHAVRPGDVDVIAAIGDSLVAGNGLLASNLMQVIVENRGLSYCIGGQGTWRQFLTLPNILKVFNPNLIGYSLNTSFAYERGSQFNVAEPGALSEDTPYMTKVLVKRITSDPRVDLKKHWKMITYSVGGNDFCSNMCDPSTPEVAINTHRNNLIEVLRTLRDNFPRTIVNIVPAPNVRLLANMTLSNQPSHCKVVHKVICYCMFSLVYQNMQKVFDDTIRRWQELEAEISMLEEFDRDDFTVVFQPFLVDYTFSNTADGLSDYTHLSADCFHLSQKENARAANALWNNILEPVGKKSKDGTPLFTKFNCPTREHPYIYTRRNS